MRRSAETPLRSLIADQSIKRSVVRRAVGYRTSSECVGQGQPVRSSHIRFELKLRVAASLQFNTTFVPARRIESMRGGANVWKSMKFGAFNPLPGNAKSPSGAPF